MAEWKLGIWTSGKVCGMCGSEDVTMQMHGWEFITLRCEQCRAETPLVRTWDEAIKAWSAMQGRMADKAENAPPGLQVFWSGDTRIVYDPEGNPEYPYQIAVDVLMDVVVPKRRATYAIHYPTDPPATKAALS